MFVFSLRANKKRIILMAGLIAVIVLGLFLTRNSDLPVTDDSGILLKAGSAEERIAFLSQFGWEIEEDPVQVEEIVIPAEFDETYEKYNEIQLAQNMDLSPYAGKTAKKWTYTVKNYPDYETENSCIRANIIVFEGAVIGGDISSLEQGGFMQGFDFPVTQKVNKTDKNFQS
ncbi:MAG: DUF4830 domain-containing protein [Clostridia bacterium]|nr:DUF4830 domain-containing protein [Clostridia bacterium]